MQTNIDKLLQKPLVVINLGLKKFAESLEEQKVEVIQVDCCLLYTSPSPRD